MRYKTTDEGLVPFTPEEEAEWDARIERNAKAQKDAAVAQKRADILAALTAIDIKSIRALREGNQTRIDGLEAQAQTLRDELAAL